MRIIATKCFTRPHFWVNVSKVGLEYTQAHNKAGSFIRVAILLKEKVISFYYVDLIEGQYAGLSHYHIIYGYTRGSP